MSEALTVRQFVTSLALGAGLLGLFGAPAWAQDPAPAEPAAAENDDPVGPGTDLPEMTQSAKRRFREPIPGPFPLIEWERYDSAKLGEHPGGQGIEKMTDLDLLFPLFGYHNERRSAREAQDAGEYGYAYAMPFFWGHWNPRAADAWVGPLYGYMRRGEQWRMFIPPLLAGGAGGPDGWDASFMFPLGWAGRRGDDWWAHLAPLIWSGGGDDRSYAGIVPAFWYDQRGDDVTFISPIAGYAKRPEFTYAGITPLVHHWRDRRRNSGGDLALPFYYHWFDERQSGHLLLPLGGSFWDQKHGRTTVLGPVFHSSSPDGDRSQGGVIPLVWWHSRESTNTGMLTVLPFVYHYHSGENDRRTVVFPFYWDFDTGRQRHQHVWPFYGYDAWRDRNGRTQHERWSVMFPIFRVWRDHGTRTGGWDLPWPIAGGEYGDDYARARVLPLMWYERQGKDWTLISAALLFGQGNAKREWAVWAPIGGYYKNHEAGTTLGVGPLSHYWSDGEWSNWSALFPLLYGASDTAGRWQVRFLWEGLTIQGEGDDSFEWRVLGKFMQYRRLGDERQFEINPLVRYHSKGDDYTYFDIFLGLYSYEREGETTHHGLFWTQF